jgi:hypothetical protein
MKNILKVYAGKKDIAAIREAARIIESYDAFILVEADEILLLELHLIFEQLNPWVCRIRLKSQQGGLERAEDRFDKTGMRVSRGGLSRFRMDCR